MRRRWDLVLAGLLVVALVALALLGAVLRASPAVPNHSAISAASEGASALAEWLVALNYDVVTAPQPRFEPPEADEVLLVLEPAQPFSDDEWVSLEQSLEVTGGRVVIVGDGLAANAVMARFGYTLGPSAEPVEAVLPVFGAPVFARADSAAATLIGRRADAAPLLVAGDAPVAVAFPIGKGSVTLATTIAAFTNQGLRDPDQARLTLNLVTSTRPTRVRFDEWHLGRRAVVGAPEAEVIGPEAWLLRTAGGRAVLFTLVLLVVALWLRGRPFGRPVPPATELVRRTALEHVDALGQLSRRAGHRRAAADDYRQRLKRVIGQRYRIDPELPDVDFLARLKAVAPGATDGEFDRLLTRLQETQDEAELVRLAHTAARRLNEETRHP